MKLLDKLHGEDGEATVFEALIVYPIVLVIVIFFLFMGFTYAQQGFLSYHASELATYLADAVKTPGFQFIKGLPYETDGKITLDSFNKAMNEAAPYRYFSGFFKKALFSEDDANIADPNDEDNNILDRVANDMVTDYLRKNGFMRSANTNSKMVDDGTFGHLVSTDGYACGVSANTSRVVVYLGQSYVFADFFRMIGIGGKETIVSAQTTAFVSDSLEIVRTTDMAFDLVTYFLEKTGLSDKVGGISEMLDKIKTFTGNKGKSL